MKSAVLNGKLRENVGKKDANQLRANEETPCVLYGGETPVHFSAPTKDFTTFLRSPEAYLVKINIDGKEYDAIIQDKQFHPLTDELLHVDFLLVEENKPVALSIPVKAVGNSEGVKAGGKLQMSMKRVRVRGLVKDIPDWYTIDITNVQLGEAVQVKNAAIEGIECLEAPNAVILAVKLTRAAMQAAAEAKKAAAEA